MDSLFGPARDKGGLSFAVEKRGSGTHGRLRRRVALDAHRHAPASRHHDVAGATRAARQVGGDLYGYYALAEGTLLANCIDSDRESITTKMVYKGCGAHDLRIGATKQGAAACVPLIN